MSGKDAATGAVGVVEMVGVDNAQRTGCIGFHVGRRIAIVGGTEVGHGLGIVALAVEDRTQIVMGVPVGIAKGDGTTVV